MEYTESGIALPPLPLPRPKTYGGRERRKSLTMGLGAVVEPDGSIAWQDEDWQFNALANEGETDNLSDWLTGTPTLLKYLALINGTTTPPNIASTMAYLGGGAGAGETQTPGSNGYNRQQLLTTDWVNDGIVGGYARFSAAEKTFGPATANWTLSHAALVSAATGQLAGSGKFLLFIPLSGTTTILTNQSFKYVIRTTVQ